MMDTAVLSAIISAAGIVIVAAINLAGVRLADANARRAATEVKTVKQELAVSSTQTAKRLDKIDNTGKAIHTLVNSDMGRQKLLTWQALKRLAGVTNDPEDARLALEAKQLYDDHEARQKIVDDTRGSP